MRIPALLIAALFVTGAGATELDGAQLYVQRTCVACHGPTGDKPLLPMYPKIAGQNPIYAEQQMRDIKDGTRNNAQTAAMKGIMHLVSDEEIKVLAEYLSEMKK